ncbi:UDP-N-acetylglucosamine 2-epimerase [candidate division WOR-1 bacterium RIFOXYA2_FULL_37_7]|nr:MAG: UDP-N-acetylglucosamine 2-epimerase [candidate division WOR-1 bacterium RIFOXYA2_FULL_37_7]
MAKKKIMLVFVTRPEAIKMAPLVLEIKKYNDKLIPLVVSTGQHREMLDQVLNIFNIRPDYDLEIMSKSQTLSQIVVKTLQGLESILLREKPDMMLVQGDTSTAFTAGLCAFYNKIPVGHVEAGLRTFDKLRPFPEEVNRRLLSVVADMHFSPTSSSVENLIGEKIPKPSIYCTGNTVIDALLLVAKRKFDIKKSGLKLDANKKIILVTAHRRESFGQPLVEICEGIKKLAKTYFNDIQIVLPAHKNPMVTGVVEKILGGLDNVLVVAPMDYEPFVHLMKASYFILTDSGGVQEEAPSLGKPVLVLREKTERPEAIIAGTVKLIGVNGKKIFSEAEKLLIDRILYKKMQHAVNPYGDGKASARIVSAILFKFGFTAKKIKEYYSK